MKSVTWCLGLANNNRFKIIDFYEYREDGKGGGVGACATGGGSSCRCGHALLVCAPFANICTRQSKHYIKGWWRTYNMTEQTGRNIPHCILQQTERPPPLRIYSFQRIAGVDLVLSCRSCCLHLGFGTRIRQVPRRPHLEICAYSICLYVDTPTASSA